MFIDRPVSRPRAWRVGLNLKIGTPLFLYLAWREIWRYKGRYFLISLVIALITVLVLFIAGLAEGLGAGNKEYIEKLNADLILYQEGVDLSIPSSRLGHAKLNDVWRIDGVEAVGSLGFSNASIFLGDNQEPLDVSLIGVEPGKPGEPPAFEGRNLAGRRDREVVIGKNVALRTGLTVGDPLTLKTIQGTEEEFYTLRVAGISDGRQYSIQPSVFVPHLTWDQIKPKANLDDEQADLIFNNIAVRLDNPADRELIARQIESQVSDVQAVDRKTAYENTPGYQAQQSTLRTQRIFTLLIGVLVIGGFFQIQTLQKVAQIGMLKAIGVSNWVIVLAFIIQIVAITIMGVLIGSLGTLLLSLSFPVTIPIVFTQESIITAVVSLLIIGPLGGLVSLRILLKVEPLTALGLAS
jgi:putative ABC transport system permease protein